MFLFKYAWLNLKASWSRNLLIGIIIIVISLASCLALSIRETAEKTRESEMDQLNVTANINVDREYVMKAMSGNQGVSREEAKEALEEIQSISLEEYMVYAEAESVDAFYYTLTTYVNGNEELRPIGETDDEAETQETSDAIIEEMEDILAQQQQPPGGHGEDQEQMMQQMQEMMQQQLMGSGEKKGEFTIIGYNCDDAMEDFQSGVKKIKEGKVFDENTDQLECIIPNNLAVYNNLNVGDSIVLQRPDNEEITVSFNIVGTYSTQTQAEYNTTTEDPDNEILMSTGALEQMLAVLNEDLGEDAKEIKSIATGIYSFANAEDYYTFEKEVIELGMTEKHTVVSNDIATYESSLLPLENLKKYAMTLLLVIMVVGIIVIVFLNALNVNSRKREIGTMAAIGMSKARIIKQYIIEICTVMVLFIAIGTAIGATLSVPVTNSLLASQVEMQELRNEQSADAFGRVEGSMTKPIGGDVVGEVEYVTTVSAATDFNVIVQVMGIALLLSLAASMMSMIFIMRCEPSKILSTSE